MAELEVRQTKLDTVNTPYLVFKKSGNEAAYHPISTISLGKRGLGARAFHCQGNVLVDQ
jgi:hypothetical protein